MLAFLIAIAAGALAPLVEEKLARPAVRASEPHLSIEPGELRAVAFMIAMLIAALLAEALDAHSPFALILGGVLGYFATRIFAAARNAMDRDDTDY